jgi:alpha-beta hydrolase superfamily lysophospholipase
MRFAEERIEKLICSDGELRSIHVWEPGVPRIVFLTVHGLMDHAGNYAVPALFFRDHGIATVALSQHGHDHLGPDHPHKVIVPRFEYFLEDLDLMVQWVDQQYPGLPVFILAHSMGGLIATHFGIRNLSEKSRIKGFILSSPYYVNAVKVHRIMRKMVGILSILLPRMIIPTEDFKEVVTHDREIYDRQRNDEREGVVVTSVTCGCANELLRAQQWIQEHIHQWKHKALVILAGDDRVADTETSRDLLSRVDPGLITELCYHENFHENFNEPNRDEIFSEIMNWVNQIA